MRYKIWRLRHVREGLSEFLQCVVSSSVELPCGTSNFTSSDFQVIRVEMRLAGEFASEFELFPFRPIEFFFFKLKEIKEKNRKRETKKQNFFEKSKRGIMCTRDESELSWKNFGVSIRECCRR